mgnify:CR=1 FL=1
MRLEETAQRLADIQRRYPDAALASSLAAEDMVLTHAIYSAGLGLEVFTLDTGRLHAETLGVLDAVREQWQALGRAAHDLRFETFGSGGQLPPAGFEVAVPRHQAELHVAPDQSLIEVLEAAGIEVMNDCRRGECGLCALDVLALEGEIDHRDVFLSAQEKQENKRICACVSRVVGRITLDTAWREEVVS